MTATPTLTVVHQETRDDGIDVTGLNAWYGDRLAVRDVTLPIHPRAVTALIGPSGCGKTTFLRTLNRLHDATPGARVAGQVTLAGADIYARGVDPVEVRRRIGMVFQRPNPFPTMSIEENVLAGIRLNRRRVSRAEGHEIVERALTGAGLWEEVRDRLRHPATGLSGGQQQRLCIARAIAVEPEALLMDEPCSALDPASTEVIEELIRRLRAAYTVVIVTHNMQQAARVSDHTAFFSVAGPDQPGELVEHGPTEELFASPTRQPTQAYLAGRFG